MKYKDIIKNSMEELAKDEKTVFIGYNLKHGSKGYGSLKDVSENKILETPVAENLMAGLATGMAIEGFKPVLIFERHDFMLNASDCLINYLNKLSILSNEEYAAPMIIRAVIGSLVPINPGPQHSEDFSDFFKSKFTFPVYDPQNVSELKSAYAYAKEFKTPCMIIERRDLYEQEEQSQIEEFSKTDKMKGVYSNQKIAFHEEKLKSLAEGRITPPLYVRIKPTNKCNHRCFYCSYDPDFGYLLSEKKYILDEIPREKMMEILDDFKEMGVKAITYSGGGEPLVYPYIEEALQKNIDDGIDISIITNGQSLSGKKAELLAKAKWVRISADSDTPEVFKASRRISEKAFYELENNLRNFAKMKNSDCEFGINFVVHEKNASHVLSSAKYFKSLGLNHIRFSPVFIPKGYKDCPEGSNKYHAPFRESVMAQIKKAKELEDKNFTVYDFYETDFDSSLVCERKYPKCFMMQVTPVIAANSSVYFCHDKAYSDSGLLGSIKNRSFKDLWFSPEAKIIFDTFNPIKGCQHHCTADGRNLAIQEMILDINNLEKYTPANDKHKNFI
jgi:MoaA/NifB/PqqE/SkfB family radical SAM enzyme